MRVAIDIKIEPKIPLRGGHRLTPKGYIFLPLEIFSVPSPGNVVAGLGTVVPRLGTYVAGLAT